MTHVEQSKQSVSEPRRRSHRLGRSLAGALVVFAALAVIMPAAGQASTVFSGSTPNTFTLNASGGIKFHQTSVEGMTLSCGEVSGSGSLTTATSGSFEASLLNCRAGALKCEAQGGGNTRFEGSLELVQLKPTIAGVLLKPKEMVFSCNGGQTVWRYRGAILAPITPLKTKTSKFTVTIAATSPGYPEYTACEIGCGGNLRLEGKRESEEYWTNAAAEQTSLALTTAKETMIEVRPIFSGTFPDTFSLAGKSGIKFDTIQVGETPIVCGEVSGNGTLTSAVTGTFEASLVNCRLGVSTCEAQGGGNTRFEGSLELAQLKPSVAGVVLRPKEMVFSCNGGSKVWRYRGVIVAPITPFETNTTQLTVAINAPQQGYPEYSQCEVGCGGNLRLEGKVEGGDYWTNGAAEGASLALTLARAVKVVR